MRPVQAALCLRALPAFFAAGMMIVATAPQASAQGTGCYFQLGFANLAKQIPDAVGKCTANERFNPANGNAEQPTDRGLLVWRKADNWTAYTDGYRTWLAGPSGLQDRLNDGPRFEWEQDIVDINANSNTNDLANTNTITAEGGNATGGAANAQGGASTNTNTNTVNPVINVVVNVPPSAPTPTAAPTPALAIVPTVLPTPVPTVAPSPAAAPAAPAPTGNWVAWGRPGRELGEFSRPFRIKVSSNGTLFVVDGYDSNSLSYAILQKLSPTDSCQCWWNSVGRINGVSVGRVFGVPVSISLDNRDSVFVLFRYDSQVPIIERYSQELLRTQDPFMLTTISNHFLNISLVVDNFGALYVSQSGSTITKLGTDGKVIATWGSKGAGPGQFDDITGIAVDGAGNLYVADRRNNRIQKLSASGGRPLAQWGSQGSGPGQFEGPNDIALDAQGNVYVADSGNHRIQKLSPDGKFLQQWGNMGQFGNKPQEGTEPGQFKSPGGVAIDVKGNIYVADTDNNRIQKLTLNP